MSPQHPRGIWILIETREGKPRDGCLELVGEGRRLADRLRCELSAVVPGAVTGEQAGILARFGADRVLSIDHPAVLESAIEPCAAVLSRVISEQSPEVVLSVDTVRGTDLASRIAARLGTALAASCDKVSVGPDGSLHFNKPIFGNKASAPHSFALPRGRRWPP